MNKYLLLRSNKQSGPYTAEDLRQLGLKPYDLVWVDGKSAAWRYPGEIDELRPFAPAVEEQPYDRFYKKSATESNSNTEAPATPQPSTQQQQQPVMQQAAIQQPQQQPVPEQQPPLPQQPPAEKPARKEKEYKRVFVTLPAGAAKPQPVAKPAAETTSNVSHTQYQPPVQQPAEIKKPEVKPATESLSEKELYERKVAIAKEAAEKTGLTSGKKGFAAKPAREAETDSYYPKKRSRLKGVPLAAMIIGMIVMTALGIVIGMWLDGDKGVSLIKRTDPVTPANNNQHPPLVPQETQRNNNDAALNQTSAQVVTDSTDGAAMKKPVVKTAPVTKKNTTATDTNQQDITANLPKEEPKLNKEEAPEKKEPAKPSAPNLEKLVFVSNNDFEVGPFGGISRLALTVKNTSDYELNLVVVQLEYLKANKEVYKTENIYFRDIAANAALTVDAPRSSRGNKINYKITLINSRDHLYHAGN